MLTSVFPFGYPKTTLATPSNYKLIWCLWRHSEDAGRDVRLPNTDGHPQQKPRKSDFTCIPICMSFNAWLLKKEIPDSDRLAMLIQSAGPDGIPETQLRSGIELPKQLVDDFLAALVDARIVRVAERDGIRWYFSPL